MQKISKYETLWLGQSPRRKNISIGLDSREYVASALLDSCEKLLDVGCGDGVFARLAKGKYLKYFGIDISQEALKTAKKYGVAERIDIDKEEIPFINFDAVICLDVIEHVFEPRDLIKKIYKSLKPNGILIISAPNIRFARHIFDLFVNGKFPKTSFEPIDLELFYDGGHLHYFTSHDIEDLLIRNDFEIICNIGITGHNRLSGSRRICRKLLGNIYREFFCGGFIIKGKKKELLKLE